METTWSFFFAGGFEGGVGAEGCGFVDGVNQVDVGVLLEAVFHGSLGLGLVAVGGWAQTTSAGISAQRRLRPHWTAHSN